MSIHKLERVMWRLRSIIPTKIKFTTLELERAIMHEIGTSPEALRYNKLALKKLGWIKRTKTRITLTGKDLI